MHSSSYEITRPSNILLRHIILGVHQSRTQTNSNTSCRVASIYRSIGRRDVDFAAWNLRDRSINDAGCTHTTRPTSSVFPARVGGHGVSGVAAPTCGCRTPASPATEGGVAACGGDVGEGARPGTAGSRRRNAGVRQSGVATPTVASVVQFHIAALHQPVPPVVLWSFTRSYLAFNVGVYVTEGCPVLRKCRPGVEPTTALPAAASTHAGNLGPTA